MKATPLFLTFCLLSLCTLAPASELEKLRAQQAEIATKIKALESQKGDASTRLKQADKTNASVAPSTSNYYVVRKGDNWEKIARKLNCSSKALASSNRLKTSSIIHPGQKLKIPGSGRSAESVKSVAKSPTPASFRTHVIREGETYTSIAKIYGTSSSRLIAANPKAKATALRGGMKIRVPGTGAVAAAGPKESRPEAKPEAKQEPKVAAAPAAAPAEKPAPQKQAPAVARKETTAPAPSPEPTAKPAPSAPAPSTPAASSPPAEAAVAKTQDGTAPAPAKEPAGGTPRIRPVTVDGEVSFSEFATRHGTDISRLNSLNGLDLTGATVLAKGSELYVPAAY